MRLFKTCQRDLGTTYEKALVTTALVQDIDGLDGHLLEAGNVKGWVV